MKTIRISFSVYLLLLLLTGCATTPPLTTGEQHPQAFSGEVTVASAGQYLLYLPPGYHAEPQRDWPLVMFLHGIGERGTDIDKVKMHGPPMHAEQGEQYPFILISPQCPPDSWWDPVWLTTLLDEVVDDHRVDEQRIYLTGLSMGGYGTWDLACSTPERFAAIAPVCGGGNSRLANRLAQSSVPVWAFHGEDDTVVPLAESEQMVDAVRDAGGEAKLTVYPGVGHGSWVPAYADPALWEWMLAQSR